MAWIPVGQYTTKISVAVVRLRENFVESLLECGGVLVIGNSTEAAEIFSKPEKLQTQSCSTLQSPKLDPPNILLAHPGTRCLGISGLA